MERNSSLHFSAPLRDFKWRTQTQNEEAVVVVVVMEEEEEDEPSSLGWYRANRSGVEAG